MTFEQIAVFSLAMMLMFLGFLGAFLPGIPSTPLVALAAIGHRLWLGDQGADWWVVITLTGITLFSMIIDYLASMVGAKKLGASRKGIMGALIGGLVGLFFGPLGLILGPFVGALAFEMIGGRDVKASSKAGTGAVLGLLAGALGKLVCCVVMILLFVGSVLFNGFSS